MDTTTRPRPAAGSGLGSDSGYARVWRTAGSVTGAVWVMIAILQTPRLPLALLVVLGAVSGVLVVNSTDSTERGGREYAAGAGAAAALVLVTVGIGHHLGDGLTVVALLAGSSPAVIRWVARG